MASRQGINLLCLSVCVSSILVRRSDLHIKFTCHQTFNTLLFSWTWILLTSRDKYSIQHKLTILCRTCIEQNDYILHNVLFTFEPSIYIYCCILWSWWICFMWCVRSILSICLFNGITNAGMPIRFLWLELTWIVNWKRCLFVCNWYLNYF